MEPTPSASASMAQCANKLLQNMCTPPSIGLYYVQEHLHKLVPNVVQMQERLVESTRELQSLEIDCGETLTQILGFNFDLYMDIDQLEQDVDHVCSSLSF